MSESSSKRRRGAPLRDDEPLFTTEMAAAFFDTSPKALRMRERFCFESNGDPIIIRRTEGGRRRYSLNDILKIAHSLRRHDKMTDRQLRLIVLRVDAFKEPVLKHRLRYRKGNNTME